MLPDYRTDPIAYEIEERSRPDEMTMLHEAGRMSISVLRDRYSARVLDLCCGTGLSMRELANYPAVECVVGIDICRPYLNFAHKALLGCTARLHLIEADAVVLPLKRQSWDVVMLASAYHHIEDVRKLRFLRNVRELLGSQGRAIMAENILPSYTQRGGDQYREAVRVFYEQVLTTACTENPSLPNYVKGLIQRVAQYGFDGDYEYKVSMEVLLRHLAEAGLSILEQARVWPSGASSLGVTSGNFVFVLAAS
jgi:ubiquinone/menaquinone biosynthesis C-methylase UbiE